MTKKDALESELQVVRRVSDLALENCDNVEQYTRRHSLCVYGIPVETNEDVVSKIDEFCKSVDIPFNKSDVDRAHRVGLKKFDKESNQHMQPVIVKFKDWKSRYKFYKARPKYNRTKKPGISFGLDLTKRRYNLLNYAREKIDSEKIAGISYVFADINCSLGIRFPDESLRFFNNKESLNKLLLDP